jgi:penicillin-insensitive murein endopeptidase
MRWSTMALLFALGCGSAEAANSPSDPAGNPARGAAGHESARAATSPPEPSATEQGERPPGAGEQPALEQTARNASTTPAPDAVAPPSREERLEAELAELLAQLPDSTSVGGPNYGSLTNAASMPTEGPGFRYNPRRSTDARFGTREMVAALMRAAAVVEREMPGSVLMINDLGLIEGGPIVHHGSHQSGRDVDVLFYLVDAEGQPLDPVGAPIDPRGRGTDYKDLADPSDDLQVRIDLPRTWRFVRALIEEGGAPLNRIFLVEHIRTMLLEHAESVDAPAETVARFADLTCQPGSPHDDHFHFRFFCAADDIAGGCHDTAPIYRWHRELLAEQGVEAVRAGYQRRRAPTVSVAQARRRAGRMHWKVTRFLERRAEWTDRPHPGRRYCR